MSISFNIFDQIKEIYEIYYASDNILNIDVFYKNDFYKMIYPRLFDIIDFLKKKKKYR